VRSQELKNTGLIAVSFGGVLVFAAQHVLLAVLGVVATEVCAAATSAKVVQFTALAILIVELGQGQILTTLGAHLCHGDHQQHKASRGASRGP
jgi:hypothetical protein